MWMTHASLRSAEARAAWMNELNDDLWSETAARSGDSDATRGAAAASQMSWKVTTLMRAVKAPSTVTCSLPKSVTTERVLRGRSLRAASVAAEPVPSLGPRVST